MSLCSDKKGFSIFKVLVIFYIIFYAIWAFYEIIFCPFLANSIDNKLVLHIVKETFIKNLVWTVPAFILIYCYEKDMFVSLKEMYNVKVCLIKIWPFLLLMLLYLLLPNILSGSFEINKDFNLVDSSYVLFVGLTEEMVFRGLLLNATVTKDKYVMPLIINSILFLIIHFPIWISKGIFIANMTSLAFLSVMLVGIFFGICFMKTRNILIPIILHSIYDLAIDLIK